MVETRNLFNIVISSTRQWNPGDEFILRGVRNIFAKLGVRSNPILYNRNPDIRSCFQDRQFFRASRVPARFVHDIDLIDLEANLKFGFFDNSLKPDTNCDFVDWVVLAGTPEWCSGRVADLYASIIKHSRPVMILGVGGGCDIYQESFREVIHKAKIFTVRDAATLAAVTAQGFRARMMPCPALLCTPNERQIDEVRRIGLIYQATARETVIWNGFSQEAYDYMSELFQLLHEEKAAKLSFEVVCHYIDEIPLARRDFPHLDVIYSYDAADYSDIYSRYDVVVGSRVHGIGMAAALGIPGVALVHDSRGSTCGGFLAEMVPIGQGLREAVAAVDRVIATAAERSARLRQHKHRTMDEYCAMVAHVLDDVEVTYSVPHEIVASDIYQLEELRILRQALEVARCRAEAPDGTVAEGRIELVLVREIQARLINVEHKLNALLTGRKEAH